MKQYRQIIVHAGFSKTGTSSIQDGCEKYRALLHERGIVYPRFSTGEKPFITHSIPLTVAITGRPGKYGVMLPQRFPDTFAEVIRSCREQLDDLLATPQGETLLLSTELIEGFDDGDMATLRACLSPRAQQLRIVAYIRSPQSGLASLLQERIKMGGLPDPWALVGRIRQKVENLQRNFPAELQMINFHEAVGHPRGLVGSFLALAGLPDADIAALEFDNRNERLGMEAYTLMRAINRRYPPRDQNIHKVARQPRDLDVLARLPGPPFELADFEDSGLRQACLDEAAWLERQLGMQFPHEPRVDHAPPWQDDTLAVLEATLRALPAAPVIECAAQFLLDEAQSCAATRPVTARQLDAIAGRLLAGCRE